VVLFVETLRTRFLRRLFGRTRGSGAQEEDITSKPEGSIFFVDRANRRIMLAITLLPPSITPAYVLALAVSQMLSLGQSQNLLDFPIIDMSESLQLVSSSSCWKPTM